MRIVIDMQGAQTDSRFRGIGRCTMSLAQAIVRNQGSHEILLALNGLFPETIEPIRVAFDGLLPRENIRVWHAVPPVRENGNGNEWRRSVAELIREAFLSSLQPDVVLQSSLFEGYTDDAVTSIGTFTSTIPTAVILYDLIPLLNPDVYLKPVPSFENYYHRRIARLKKADAWLAISESAGDEGRKLLGIDPAFVTVVTIACDSVFQKITVSQKDKEQLLARYGVTRPFLLYFGGADEHKNLSRLIRAYAQLSDELRGKHQLLFAGNMREGVVQHLKSEARSAGLRGDELCFTGYVSDEELVKLYNLCELFVFPSWHEGFGLPPLEAMACGAAVIGSNTSSIPEVIGRDDALFDPFDISDISVRMQQVLESESFRRELAEYGLARAKLFSWDKSAKVAISALDALYRARSGTLKSGDSETLLRNLIQRVSEVIPADIAESKLLGIAHALGCVQPGNQPQQLFVDISELAQRDARTGVQRVTRNILKELLTNPPEGFVVVPVYATPDRPGYRYARKFTAQFCNLPDKLDDDPIDYRAGDIFFGLDLQPQLIPAQIHYLKAMRMDGVKVLFVVYDLLPITLPHCFHPSMNAAHAKWLLALAEFDGAICISRTVADELSVWLAEHGPNRVGRFSIDWYHNGADLDSTHSADDDLPEDAKRILDELAKRPTFLSVGTIEPRKGQSQTLEAFENLWSQGIQVNLVLVGKQGWQVESLVKKLRTHPELGKRLFWLEGISDGYLEKVYAASSCLIAASLGEGFGLPLIEAAQRKLPIIARDIPVFREVAGEHAFYFSGNGPADLAAAVTDWMQIYQGGNHPKSDDMPWLTWRESAERLVRLVVADS